MKSLWMKPLSLIVAAGALGACATAVPVEQKQKQAAEATLQEKAKVYHVSVHSVAQSELKPGGCYRMVTKLKGNWDWKAAVETADNCMRTKDYARVIDIGNELASRDPSAPWGPYFLGLAALENNELERALWMTELALKRGQDLGVVHYLKGQILWTKKDFKNSVASFEKAVELDDSMTSAHLFLGQIYYRDQEFGRASKHFHAVAKAEPRHPVALAGLAESQLHENNPQSALDAYWRLADAYPKDGQYLTRIAEIYETVMNDPVQALTTYRRVRDLVRSGQITRNIDPQNGEKIRELELSQQQSSGKRSVATTSPAVNAGQEKRSGQ